MKSEELLKLIDWWSKRKRILAYKNQTIKNINTIDLHGNSSQIRAKAITKSNLTTQLYKNV